MHRFFLPPSAFAGPIVTVRGAQAHQIRRVLRLRPGDRVIFLDNTGRSYEAALAGYGDGDASFEVVEERREGREPATRIRLFQAVMKGERFDWLLQKGTEAGIHTFVPVVCERNVVGDLEAIEGKRERWERIIQEAAEQSGRALLPILARPRRLQQALHERFDGENGPPALRLIAWEEEREQGLRGALGDCNGRRGQCIELFIGPEGGFTHAEIESARASGAVPVSLGPRVLRAETAGIVAAGAILFACGDFEPQTERQPES